MGVRLGLGREQILYSAPGKTERDIRGAIHRSILVADSLGELERIDRIAGEEGITAEVGIRINPNFTMDSDHGSRRQVRHRRGSAVRL